MSSPEVSNPEVAHLRPQAPAPTRIGLAVAQAQLRLRPAWLHLILYGSASVDPSHALDVLLHIVTREATLDVPGSGASQAIRHGRPEESPRESHTVSVPPATMTPVMSGTEMRLTMPAPGEEELQCMDAFRGEWSRSWVASRDNGRHGLVVPGSGAVRAAPTRAEHVPPVDRPGLPRADHARVGLHGPDPRRSREDHGEPDQLRGGSVRQ